MKRRASKILCALLLSFVSACGGESVSSPPPDLPPPSGGAEPADRAEPPPPPPEADHGPEPTAAPEPEEKPKAAAASKEAPVSEVPGANLSVGQLEADGLVTKDITCKTEGGGMALLGAVLVTAWISPQKKALDACAPAGTETRVVWKARGGKVTEVHSAGSPKVKACVERALAGGKPVLEGHCAATVVHGK